MRSLVTYRPNGLSLFDEMDRVFDSLFNDLPSFNNRIPSVDVREEEGRYILEAELPGMTEKDIEVKVDENLLSISANKMEEKKEEKKNGYLLKERRSSSFKRSFVLPKDADREKINASFKNGLLSLEIPKTEKAKPKLIKVKES